MDWHLKPAWTRGEDPPITTEVAATIELLRRAPEPGRLVLTGTDSVSIAAVGIEALVHGWQVAFPAGGQDIDRWGDSTYTLRLRADLPHAQLHHGHLPQRDGQWDVAMSTSGTTRRPRTFGFTLAQLSGVCNLYQQLYGLDAEAIILTALPAAHNFAFVAGVCAAAATGAGMLFAPTHTDVIAQLARHRTHNRVVVLASPVLLEQEGIEQVATANLLIDSGTAPVSRPHILALRERGADIREGYGTTETLSLTHFDTLGTVTSAGTVGTTLSGISCRIGDGDLVEVRTPYLGTELDHQLAPGPTNFSHWTSTGDVGVIDQRGQLRILGRAGDQSIAGLWPRDILDALGETLGARTASITTQPDSLTIHVLHPLPEDVHRCLVDLCALLTTLPKSAIEVTTPAHQLTYSMKLPRPDTSQESR